MYETGSQVWRTGGRMIRPAQAARLAAIVRRRAMPAAEVLHILFIAGHGRRSADLVIDMAEAEARPLEPTSRLWQWLRTAAAEPGTFYQHAATPYLRYFRVGTGAAEMRASGAEVYRLHALGYAAPACGADGRPIAVLDGRGARIGWRWDATGAGILAALSCE